MARDGILGGLWLPGLFAVQIMATADTDLQAALAEFKEKLVGKISAKDEKLQASL